MNQIMQEDKITELQYENNISYILKDSSFFQSTEFKVLCHQQNGVFVHSSKMMLNGKVQLYYYSGNFVSLESVMKAEKIDDNWKLVTELFCSLLEVKKIGFLSISNIVTEASHIFVEPTTGKVRWIYLPILTSCQKSEKVFEREILEEVKQELTPLLSDTEKERIDEIWEINQTLEQVVAKLKNSIVITGKANKSKRVSLRLKLQPMGGNDTRVIIDDQDEFLIGRKVSAVDFAVQSNHIGRIHCKLIRSGYSFFVMDLQSVNGTFVNGELIRANVMVPLSNGDKLQLANIEYLVVVEE